VLYRALNVRTMRAVGILSTSYSVHVCGDGSVVSTTKSEQVDLIFAWEALFALCMYGGWSGYWCMR